MATYQSDVGLKQDRLTDLAYGIDQRPSALKVDGFGQKVLKATYTLLATEVATETLDLWEFQAGDIFLPQQSAIVLTNPGTALTIDIGDGTTADKYVDGLALGAGGTFLFAAGTSGNLGPDEFSAATHVQVTIMTATTLTAAVVVNFYLAFCGKITGAP